MRPAGLAVHDRVGRLVTDPLDLHRRERRVTARTRGADELADGHTVETRSQPLVLLEQRGRDRARRLGTLGFGGDELSPHNLLGFVEVLLRDRVAGEQIAQLRFQLDHLLGHRLGELHDLQQLVLE